MVMIASMAMARMPENLASDACRADSAARLRASSRVRAPAPIRAIAADPSASATDVPHRTSRLPACRSRATATSTIAITRTAAASVRVRRVRMEWEGDKLRCGSAPRSSAPSRARPWGQTHVIDCAGETEAGPRYR
jgi:hypothetical protein